MGERASVLVLGLGNALLSDDGAGVHAVRMIAQSASAGASPPGLVCRDGGTIGLALLDEIARADALIVIDAARIGAPPGTVQVFCNEAFDTRVRSSRASAHDLALAELIDAAHLTDALPSRRALIAIEPASTAWGLAPTPPVLASLPETVALARKLAAAWSPAPLETTA